MASSRGVCDPCIEQGKTSPGDVWCTHCNETLCVDCKSHHQLRTPMKNHNLVEVNFKINMSEKLSKTEFCNLHSQNKLEYYSPVHDIIYCRTCLIDENISFDDVNTLDIACQNGSKSLLYELDDEMENMQTTLKYLEDEQSKKDSVNSNDSKIVEQKIAEAKTKAIDRINEYEQKLLAELHSEERVVRSQQLMLQEKRESVAETLVTNSKILQFTTRHGTAKQAFLLAHSLKPTLEKIDESISDIAKGQVVTTFRFNENRNLIQSIPALGTISKSEQPSQIKHTPIKEKYAQCIIPRIEIPLTSFKLTYRFRTSDTVNIMGIAATEDNKVIICNYTNKNEVLIYSDYGQYVCSITMKHWPYDVAVLPGGDQYVVTLPCISSIQYINTQDLRAGKIVEFLTQHYICGISADKQYVYVGEYNKIFMLNHEGTVTRKIELTDLCHVFYLVVNDDIIYASNNNNKIHCIHQNRIIRQIQVPGVGTVRKLSVDRHGYIYVCGEQSGNIHRLDKDLKEHLTIGDESIERIAGICFNKNCRKLFVASESGKTISVFSCT